LLLLVSLPDTEAIICFFWKRINWYFNRDANFYFSQRSKNVTGYCVLPNTDSDGLFTDI